MSTEELPKSDEGILKEGADNLRSFIRAITHPNLRPLLVETTVRELSGCRRESQEWVLTTHLGALAIYGSPEDTSSLPTDDAEIIALSVNAAISIEALNYQLRLARDDAFPYRLDDALVGALQRRLHAKIQQDT